LENELVGLVQREASVCRNGSVDRRRPDRIYLLRAKDFAKALERALSLGRVAEQEFRNSGGQRVFWKLKEVVSLDVLSTQDLDKAEICADSIHPDAAGRIPFGTTFKPEASKPKQTI
jgi:uncharacterized protein YuzB (UPF0349 family)